MENGIAKMLEERGMRVSWHMPGHKGKPIGRLCWSEDVTELLDTDNLQEPSGPILWTERRIAALHGARASFLSVNGSSGMILAAMSAAFKPGDGILAVRNAHRSFFNACVHVDARPVYLMPEVDAEWGFAGKITPGQVRRALEGNPHVRGLFVTNPTYEGVAYDLTEIAFVLHEEGRLLLVDEAHGAHLPWIGGPKPALEMGADLVIQSYHKMLPSPTQTAVLHLGSDRVEPERIREAVRLFQTTSPSYLLLKGLDLCRSYMENLRGEQIEAYRASLMELRRALEQTEGLRLFPSDDPAKILFRLERQGRAVDGDWTLRALLAEGMELEGVFNDAVLAISTIMDTLEDHKRLLAAVRTAARADIPEKYIKKEQIYNKRLANMKNYAIIQIPEAVMSLRDAFYAETERIPLQQAEGRLAAAFITPYPPGIPALCPGERISERMIRYLSQEPEGVRFIGLGGDHTLNVICKKEEEQ